MIHVSLTLHLHLSGIIVLYRSSLQIGCVVENLLLGKMDLKNIIYGCVRVFFINEVYIDKENRGILISKIEKFFTYR